MKKSIISIIGLITVLSSAIIFNIAKYERSKPKYCIIARYEWGLKIADFSTDGNNSAYCCLKSNKYGATIGNTSKYFYTWHIN